MRILFVEDDIELSKIVKSFLSDEGYIVDTAHTINDATHKIRNDEQVDLLILDVILPDGNGIEFCRTLRLAEYSAPILMLTAKNTTLDTVTGLDAGADDYMPKPFSRSELSARIRSLLRRPKEVIRETISCGELTLNINARSAQIQNNEILLMPKEFSLLEYLMRRKNEVVKKEEILRNVWGVYSNTSSNRLEVYIRYLREKLQIDASTANIIRTIRGKGYMITDD